jgi:hypothetical protein
MASTISTSKLIAAFNDVKGKTFYIIFEETYDSNTYPRTPKWCARAIGDLAAMMRLIFWSGSSAEGGMLKGTGGRSLTPEGYIAAWLRELANPVEIEDQCFDLSVGDGWNAVIGRDVFAKTQAKLEAIGEGELACALDQGQTVSVSLFGHAEALSVIFDGVDLGAWRILKGYNTPVYAPRNPALGYAPAKVKPPLVDLPRAVRISPDDPNLLTQHADGSWRCDGWGYGYVANYVTDLWETELKYPGSYRSLIKNYRETLATAPVMPTDGVTIVVDTSFPLGAYAAQNVQRIQREFDCKTFDGAIHIPFSADFDFRYQVTHLPVEATKWVFGGKEEAEPQRHAEQLCLLAS